MKRDIALSFALLFLVSCSENESYFESMAESTALATIPIVTAPPATTEDIFWDICDGAVEPNLERDISPSGTWFVVNCDSENTKATAITKIAKIDKSIVWDLSFYEVFGNEAGINDGKMIVAQWSYDERFVYLKPYFCCTDSPQDYFFNYFQNGRALYRLDLKSGEHEITLQPNPDNLFAGYAYKFSPNNKILASINSEKLNEINILDLDTGKTSIIQINKPLIGGALSWSPDSENILVVTTDGSWVLETKTKDNFTYLLLDMKNSSLTVLFKMDTLYLPVRETPDSILLQSIQDDSLITYDLSQRQFISTLTP